MCPDGEVADEIQPHVQEVLTHIAGTPVRTAILSALETETLDLRDLSDRLQTPRTTLRHNLQKMIEGELIEETLDNEYRTTPLGRAVLDGLTAFGEHVETATHLEPLFECLWPSQLDIEISSLSTASVTEATRVEPYAPHMRLTALLGEGTDIWAYVPTDPFLFEQPDEPVFRDSHGDISLLVSPDVAEVLYEYHETKLATAVAQGPMDIGVVGVTDMEYGVGVIDDRAVVLGLDDNDKPHALVETTDQQCQEWAIRQIEELQADATPIRQIDGKNI